MSQPELKTFYVAEVGVKSSDPTFRAAAHIALQRAGVDVDNVETTYEDRYENGRFLAVAYAQVPE